MFTLQRRYTIDEDNRKCYACGVHLRGKCLEWDAKFVCNSNKCIEALKARFKKKNLLTHVQGLADSDDEVDS